MKQEQVMTEQQTLESNELIAIFMGYERYEDSYGIWFKKEDMIISMHPKLEDLKYHRSWDWLMKVVEKIGDTRVKSLATYNSDLMFRIEIVNGYTKIEGTSEHIFYNSSVEGSMIAATFKAVIHFINWYNSYTTKTQP